MASSQKAATSAKKRGKVKDEGVLLDAENVLLNKKVETLQQRLMLKDKEAAKYIENEEKARERFHDIDELFSKESTENIEVANGMDRQHSEMTYSFQEIISDIQEQIEETRLKIDKGREELENTRKEKDEEIRKQNEEIQRLKKKFESMTSEFTKMLEQILSQMIHRTEMTHSSWESEQGKLPIVHRLRNLFAMDSEDSAPLLDEK